MDIVAHGLWMGVAVVAVRRRRTISRPDAIAAVGLAVLPDVAQLVPLVAYALSGEQGWSVLLDYATALPGFEPHLPPLLALLTHHLHCLFHSAVVAGGVSVALLLIGKSFWFPLLGWWSHIVIDVFTHSAEFYPVPVLYPFTQRGFDGLAWNTPGFQIANYTALALATVALWLTRPRRG